MIRSGGKSNSVKWCDFLLRIKALFGGKSKEVKGNIKSAEPAGPISNVSVDNIAVGNSILKVNERILSPSSLKLQRMESHNKMKLHWKGSFFHHSFLIQMNSSNPEAEASWMTCGISNEDNFEIQVNGANKTLWYRVSAIQGNERSQWSVELMYSPGRISH